MLTPRSLLSGETRDGQATKAFLIRVAAGLVFVAFSFGKFVRHAEEASAFDRYGLPWPSLFTYAIGVTELVCGVLLVLGIAPRLVALVLAGNMIGAISTAGRIDGGPIHLGLAPLLLVGMLFLVWAGPGRRPVRGATTI